MLGVCSLFGPSSSLSLRSCLRVGRLMATFSTSSPLREAEGEVLTEKLGNARFVTLNRPKALNALNLPQIRYLYPNYQKWEEDAQEKVIVLQGTGQKAFCAGGDIRAIYDSGIKEEGSDPNITKEFFYEEYKLNNRIAQLTTPQVALLDGITMGGGVGLSVHGKVRVAFNSSVFAMPETAIGFFCDVGGSFFLSRLPHNFGVFLGLTGARLKGADLVHFGIATHYCPEHSQELEESLKGVDDEAGLEAALAKHTESLPESKYSPSIIEKIEKCFGALEVEEILERLNEYKEEEWAALAIKGLNKASPTSLKVVLMSLQTGKFLSLVECLKMEYRMSQTFMENKDFFTGVKATLITRDPNPQWNPPSLSEVSQKAVQKYFEHLPEDRELKFDEWDLKRSPPWPPFNGKL